MIQTFACPDLPELLHFNLGELTDEEAEALEEHLAGCPRCVALLQDLQPHDTLIDAMRALDTVTDRPRQNLRVEELIRHLKDLHPLATPEASRCTSSSRSALAAMETYDFLAPAERPDEIGRLGAYRVLRVLGVGGMGVVFQAEDTQLHRLVALKVLHPALAATASARQRFFREARAAAAVEHDHLVPIYFVGEARGVPYMAMQLLQGETLEQRLNREGRLSLAEVLRIGQEIAEGLAAAHARGLIHRDIKPSNIWLEGGRVRVKILDFGLARPAAEDAGLTDPGLYVGTPLYGAPEQAGGGPVDHRCDLFSLGSVLYTLCTGQTPFPGESNLAVLRRVCDETPRPILEINPDAPDWLGAIIARLHAKNPADRYQAAAEVAEVLSQQRMRLDASAAPSRNGTAAAGIPHQHLRPAARHWLRWGAATALLLLLAGLGFTEAMGITTVRTLVVSMFDKEQTPLPAPAAQVDGDPARASASENAAAPGDPQAPAQAPRVYPAALFPFEERGTEAKGYGAKVSDLLFAKLATRPELFLVDRNDLKKTLQELELNLSGMVKPGDATRVGQLTGAKILVSGSVVHVDKKLYLVVRIIGTETSRVLGASVDGKVNDELGPLVAKLADAVADTIEKHADKLVAPPVVKRDRVKALNQKLKNAKRPALWVQIAERHIGLPRFDPAAQTEFMLLCKGTNFPLLDPDEAARGQADILITGEGISELAARHGNLVSVKARVELKAVDRKTGKVLAVDRQTAVVVDLAEQIAGKAALQQAAAAIAARVLPQLVKQ